MKIKVWETRIIIKNGRSEYSINFVYEDTINLLTDNLYYSIIHRLLSVDINKTDLELEYRGNEDKYRSEFERIDDILDQINNIELEITKDNLSEIEKVDISAIRFETNLPDMTFSYHPFGLINIDVIKDEIDYSEIKIHYDKSILDTWNLMDLVLKYGFDHIISAESDDDATAMNIIIEAIKTIIRLICACHKQFYAKVYEIIHLNDKARYMKIKSANN